MKFTLSWLHAHLDTDASCEAIADRLTAIGLEVESVRDPGAALAPFRTARILDAAPHPGADRLRVCVVDAGGEPAQVVCGAPNARAGLMTVFAPPGAVIPGSGAAIKVGEIRGVRSQGMLCSWGELGLPGDAQGIAELPGDTPPGRSYAEWAGLRDPLIEIAVTPNRGDALGVRGIARDLAAAGLGALRPLPGAAIEAAGPSAVAWRNDWPEACPWVLGRGIRGVRNGPSPAWLRARLESCGLRSINTLVDVTNFFAIDLGRPLHVFDVDRVAGRELRIRPGADERFTALGGRELVATAEDCVIADATGVQSLAGIVGAETSGCTEATRHVFVECALFDPARIGRSGRRHGLVSDARQRFERGIDPSALPAMLDAATRMILDLCGGRADAVAEAGGEPAWRRRAALRFERLHGLGGLAMPAEDAAASLRGLGFTIESMDAERLEVTPPPWRNDIAPRAAPAPSPTLPSDRAAILSEAAQALEAECDLVEEVLRLRGLDAAPALSLPALAAVPAPAMPPSLARAALARRTLAAAGLIECVTFSFLDRDRAALFGAAGPRTRLLNPIAADVDQLRPTPLATLALAAARNQARGAADPALFEIGPGFGDDAGPDGQRLIAAGLRCGRTARHPHAASRPCDALDAKGDALAVLAALGMPEAGLGLDAAAPPGRYHPGRAGAITRGPRQVLARFGELHPLLLEKLGMQGPAAAFEIMLDAIPEPRRRRRAAPELPALQPVRRDFAFLVAADIPAEAVLLAARNTDRASIVGAALFDVFAGPGLPAGQKSVGIEITIQPRDRSATEAELEEIGRKVEAKVAKAAGGVLRC